MLLGHGAPSGPGWTRLGPTALPAEPPSVCDAGMSSPSEYRTVADLMTQDLIALRPEDRVGRARDALLTLGIHALPVMVGNDVVGIVTSLDLVDDRPEDQPISTLMTKSPGAIDAEGGVREAAELMIERGLHHLLVESEGEVIGILSSLDLLRAFVSSDVDTDLPEAVPLHAPGDNQA